MAAESRGPTADLVARLAAEPGAFDFFEAVRALEGRAALDGGSSHRRPIGYDEPPGSEAVRLRVSASLAFSAGAIAGFVDRGDAPPEMLVAFLGLIGPSGVLPQHYTELVIQRGTRSGTRKSDTALRDFLDLLHHRTLALFYRAWRKYRLPFAHEHALRWSERDPYQHLLACLVGAGTAPLGEHLSVAERARIAFPSHFARSARTADGLESLLGDFLGVPVLVRSFVGRWIEIPEHERSRLPTKAAPGRNHALGAGLVLGARTWEASSTIRLEIGPLSRERYAELRPDRELFAQVEQLAKVYVDGALDVEVELVLAPDAARPAKLGARGDEEVRLGLSSWLAAPRPRSRPERLPFSLDPRRLRSLRETVSKN